jgi:very-short-patch-repair endonuclease
VLIKTIYYTFNFKYLAVKATNMHYNASKTIFQYAEVLRKNMKEAEKIVWERLCKNKLG